MNNLFSLNQVQCHQHCANLANHSINSPSLSFLFFIFFNKRRKIRCQDYFSICLICCSLHRGDRHRHILSVSTMNKVSQISTQWAYLLRRNAALARKTLQNPTSVPEPDREQICVSVRFVFESNCWQCADWETMHSALCKFTSISYMI